MLAVVLLMFKSDSDRSAVSYWFRVRVGEQELKANEKRPVLDIDPSHD